jgi:hypothetical protein
MPSIVLFPNAFRTDIERVLEVLLLFLSLSFFLFSFLLVFVLSFGDSFLLILREEVDG